MSNVTYVKGEELTALANGLKSKGENILNTYKGDCSQAIQLSSECLQVSGLSSANFLEALEKIYSQVNDRLASFADFLTNVVVQEYAAVSEAKDYINENVVLKTDVVDKDTVAEDSTTASAEKVVSEQLFLEALEWKTEM